MKLRLHIPSDSLKFTLLEAAVCDSVFVSLLSTWETWMVGVACSWLEPFLDLVL